METRSQSEGHISTKELFKQFFNFTNLVFKNWRIWTAALLLGTIISLFKDLAIEKTSLYRSTIIFNLELGGNGASSQMSGIASAFGLMNNNGASSGDLFTSQNFPTIVRSRAIMERALMKTVVVNGDSLLMINFIADSSDIAVEEWGGSLFRKPFQAAIDYQFEKKDPSTFDELESLVINSIYDKVKDVTSVDLVQTTSSIMVLTSKLTNELLVKKWVQVVLQTTEEFYVEMKTQKTRMLLEEQEEQLNKILIELRAADKELARIIMENPNVVDPYGRMRETQLTRKSTFLTNQYMALSNTIEGLNKVLVDQTPIFTIMEESRLPLEKEDSQSGLDLKLISLAFFFLSIIAVVIIDMYRKIMHE